MKVIVAHQYTTKNLVYGWMVGITGESKDRMFLRSAKKAMGYMFILKNQTGLQISDNCLQRLSHAYKQERKLQEQKEYMERVANKPLDEEAARQREEEQMAQQPEKKQRKPRQPRQKKNTVSAK